MADLLDVLEIGHSHAIGSSAPLRLHIDRIDDFMRLQIPYGYQIPTQSTSASHQSHPLLPQSSSGHHSSPAGPSTQMSSGRPLVSPPNKRYSPQHTGDVKFNLTPAGGPISGLTHPDEGLHTRRLHPSGYDHQSSTGGAIGAGYGPSSAAASGVVGVLAGGPSVSSGEVQIPPELLEDMPWPFTYAEGFGL